MQIVEKQTPEDLHLIKSKASHFRSITTMYRSLSHQDQADLARVWDPVSRRTRHSPGSLHCRSEGNSPEPSRMESVPGDYSKRVYQGVRVKHTVKDLLAEKRSRQTSNSRFNSSVSNSQSPFAQMPGSPVTSGYYGVRRSFLSDSDFHSPKQLANDVCTSSSSSAAKPFAGESPAAPGPAGLLDAYFPEPYADPRPPGLPPSAGSLLGASALPPLLPPPFPGDPSHLVLRDSWEQTVPDGLSQTDLVPADTLQTLPPSTGCLSQMESGSTTQHRSSSWGSPLAGAQSYSLHMLEDLYHVPGYPTPSPYPFTPFMTMSNELPHKAVPLSPEEGTDTSSLQDPSSWTKEDGSLAWGSYECRRAY